MKPILWLGASPVLLMLGLVSLSTGFKGNATVNFGYPLPANTIELAVKASGGWVALTYLLVLASMAAFVAGVISAIRSGAGRSRAISATQG